MRKISEPVYHVYCPHVSRTWIRSSDAVFGCHHSNHALGELRTAAFDELVDKITVVLQKITLISDFQHHFSLQNCEII